MASLFILACVDVYSYLLKQVLIFEIKNKYYCSIVQLVILQTFHISVLHTNLPGSNILLPVKHNNILCIHKYIPKFSYMKQQELQYASILVICSPGESCRAPSHLRLGSVPAFEAQISRLQVGRVKEHLLLAVAAS